MVAVLPSLPENGKTIFFAEGCRPFVSNGLKSEAENVAV
jgi:hypothetical protein